MILQKKKWLFEAALWERSEINVFFVGALLQLFNNPMHVGGGLEWTHQYGTHFEINLNQMNHKSSV